ncbi:hypothetical protein F4820DRAFT_425980 [Hypoxylon rubiginosum]|uniref:Uncharacterized protein n=1 Tax=Hypoxylon rubiginosum TaxID=110542 RepID=A0ACB9YWZ6_9PEZI|nr:hypothetical protein F4820DRAFT_425980 [Hypoxylon rubiginosum]
MRSAGVPSTPSSRAALTGLFRNGVWHCNCSPRLPAVRLVVRKDTPNKGRSFYTCQKDREKANKCDFFLWAEDASEREIGSVLSNSRSEIEGTPSRRPKRQRTIHESITPAKEKRHWSEKTPVTSIAELNRLTAGTPCATAVSSTVKGSPAIAQEMSPDDLERLFSSDSDDLTVPTTGGASRLSATQNTPSACAKRKRADVDEYSDFSADEEEALVALVNSSSQSSQDKRRNVFDTPAAATSTTHVLEDGMPSPLTERPVRRVLFADPEVSNSKKPRANGGLAASIHNRPLGSSPALTTPSSSQESGSGVRTTPGRDTANVTQEVMSLLEGQKLDGGVLHFVRSALERHAAQAKGLERGRDASREAAKKAEGRAAELQQRVDHLENQRRLDAEARQKTRTDLMKLYRES